MNVLILLTPLGLTLALVILGALVWAVRGGPAEGDALPALPADPTPVARMTPVRPVAPGVAMGPPTLV